VLSVSADGAYDMQDCHDTILGERVMARTFEHQVVELQVRTAVLNRFTHLGTPLTRAVA
jgi:hypothetical protein